MNVNKPQMRFKASVIGEFVVVSWRMVIMKRSCVASDGLALVLVSVNKRIEMV